MIPISIQLEPHIINKHKNKKSRMCHVKMGLMNTSHFWGFEKILTIKHRFIFL